MRYVIAVMICLLPWITGCEKLKNSPVSMVDSPLVGDWYGEKETSSGDVLMQDRLLVQVKADGYVNYHFLSCEIGIDQPIREKRLDLKALPITRLNSVKMVLQSFPLTPKFELTLAAWPDENLGVWVVDTMELRSISIENLPSPEQWQCQNMSAQ